MSTPDEALEIAPAPEILPVLRAAGLRYSSACEPGYRREGSPGAFRYLDEHGRVLRDSATLERIRKLAIPPAWTDIWICSDPDGHLQVTGRDVRGRKQYRYHADWRARRDEHKFDRLAQFGRALPALRTAVARDLGRTGMPREKVLAAMVSLLDRTFVRVGHDRYRRANGSYGLTTLRNRHVKVEGDRVRIRFRGKSGKEHDIALADRRIARVLRSCIDLPGYELFRYVDDEGPRTVSPADVNTYLQALAGEDYTAKDFRTWGGTVIAAEELRNLPLATSQTEGTRNVNAALRVAAAALGNTLAVCRKSYVHPGVVKAYLDGEIDLPPVELEGLRPDEQRTLALLDACNPVGKRKRPPRTRRSAAPAAGRSAGSRVGARV